MVVKLPPRYTVPPAGTMENTNPNTPASGSQGRRAAVAVSRAATPLRAVPFTWTKFPPM
jgi:hypothetical protein